jgi:PAS domain S-box-containing protein
MAMVVGAAGCNYLLRPVYSESHYSFFSVAVLASALWGGMGPGLLATAVSALLSAYFFVAPFHSFRIEAPEAAQRLAIFVIEGTIISFVGRVIRNNRTPELASTFHRYVLAVVPVAGAIVIKLVLFPALERRLPFTFFYSAIVATAWVGGAGPALLAAALSAACVHFLFFGVAGQVASEEPGLTLFLLETTVLCLLTASFRQRLVETRAQLGRVFEDSPLGVLIIDGALRILRANPAFRQLLSSDESQLERRAVIDLVDPHSRERVRAFLDQLIRQQTTVLAEQVCLANETAMVWVNLHGSWIRKSAGRPQNYLLMVKDITEQRRTEEALQETEARLQRGQRMEAIGMFAGGVAHDFNNLLAVMFGCCERLLYRKDLPEEARRYAEELLQTAKTAADLTRQLLMFARRQPGIDQVVPVNAVVTEIEGLLRRLVGTRIELQSVLAPETGSVRADPSQLQQVLMNLAANARDAMPCGGQLTIRTFRTNQEASPQTDTAIPAGPHVTLQVSDTGQGMDETVRSRVFEPLFTTKDLGKGTGLGLATVSSIVKKLGGHIDVDSSPGKGACFSIHLPCADPQTEGSSPRVEHHRAADCLKAEPKPKAAA